MRKLAICLSIVCFLFSLTGHTLAHTPLCSCWDNGDGSITCEGGFSDGSSASGVKIYVLKDGKKLIKGETDEYSEFTFDKPKGDYKVIFDAGEGHQVEVKGKDIY